MPYKDPEKARASQRRSYARRREKVLARIKKWRMANPDKVREMEKKWDRANPDKAKAIHRRWYRNNTEKAWQSTQRWRLNNPEAVRAIQKRNYEKNIKPSASRKLCLLMSTDIRRSLKNHKKAGRRWLSLVPYTVNELKVHLESLFLPGMTWENHGSVWEIDHKIPRAYFADKIVSAECWAFKQCWALDNLQPMWKEENRKKSDKILYPLPKEGESEIGQTGALNDEGLSNLKNKNESENKRSD